MNNAIHQSKENTNDIFNSIAPTYDFLNKLLSCGIDIYWRKKLINLIPNKKELSALDLATGTGDVALAIEKNNNIQSVTGIDPSSEMLKVAQQKSTGKNIEYIVAKAQELPFESNSFDIATISFGIRNFSEIDQSLKEISRVLKPGGKILILEFSLPKLALVKYLYLFYFRKVLPFVGNLISGHKSAYTYLNSSVEDFPYGDEFIEILKRNHFKNANYKSLTFGISSIYWAYSE